MDLGMAFVTLTLFTLMLTLGLNRSLVDLTSLERDPAVLVRGLIVVLVLVPAVIFALLWFFDLSPQVATGLALLAAVPGAPMTSKRAEIAAADPIYTSSLQLALALSAILVTPLILGVFYAVFDLAIEQVSPIAVAKQIAMVTFLPVAIGLVLQRFAPNFVKAIIKPINTLGLILLVLLVLGSIAFVVMAPELRAALNLGGSAFAAILIAVVAALAIGHLAAGDNPARKGGLAVAAVARNIGLALYILGLSDNGPEMVPTVVVFLLVGMTVAILYSLWIRRQVA